MSNMMGIINLDGANSMLKELCERRPVASLPVAGRYRVIDFAVSSMVNSGIDNVGVRVAECRHYIASFGIDYLVRIGFGPAASSAGDASRSDGQISLG